MKTAPAIALLIAGLVLADGLFTIGQPRPAAQAPDLPTLLAPLVDQIGSFVVELLQWLASTLQIR